VTAKRGTCTSADSSRCDQLEAECERLKERVRELESLPKERKCRDCERMFTVDLDHPRRRLCNVCVMEIIVHICPDCGGADKSHTDMCPRSPTVQALRGVVAAWRDKGLHGDDWQDGCEDAIDRADAILASVSESDGEVA